MTLTGRSARTLALALALVAMDVAAQQNSSSGVNSAKPQASAPSGDRAQKQSSAPVSNQQALYLVRSVLLTLNDANRSGNYTVLRDLAAPEFQAKNTAADLAQSFSDLRRRNFDLFGAALIDPQFTSSPALDQNGRLRVTGFFPTRPQRIAFDLLFEVVRGQWRLFGISVATPDAPSTQSRNLPQPGPHPSGFYRLGISAGTVGLRW